MMDGQLETFDDRHGEVVLNALATYAQNMREVAAEALGGAHAPEPPPAQDGSTISLRPTRNGFASMARAFTEAADRADEARKAYEAMTGRAG